MCVCKSNGQPLNVILKFYINNKSFLKGVKHDIKWVNKCTYTGTKLFWLRSYRARVENLKLSMTAQAPPYLFWLHRAPAPQHCVKGVCHEIFYLTIFHDSNPSGPLINRLKYFRNMLRFRRDIRFFKKLRGLYHTL